MNLGLIVITLAWTIIGSLVVCKVIYPVENEGNREKTDNIKTHKHEQYFMYNERLDIRKPYHHGFSWTVLLFGFIPALFREDWRYALIMFILSFLSCGLSNIYFAIKYNEIYIRELEQKGYIRI